MKKVRRTKRESLPCEEPESDDVFAFIAGYTEGGYAYGITWEEMDRTEQDNQEVMMRAGKKTTPQSIGKDVDRKPLAFEPEHIVNFFHQFHIVVEVTRYRGGLSIYVQPGRIPLARLVPVGTKGDVEVLWWSHRSAWASIGDFDGIVLPLTRALQYIRDNDMGCFDCGHPA